MPESELNPRVCSAEHESCKMFQWKRANGLGHTPRRHTGQQCVKGADERISHTLHFVRPAARQP